MPSIKRLIASFKPKPKPELDPEHRIFVYMRGSTRAKRFDMDDEEAALKLKDEIERAMSTGALVKVGNTTIKGSSIDRVSYDIFKPNYADYIYY